MTGTILLTGGTGKTAIPLANKLQSRNISVLLASRNAQSSAPPSFTTVSFDWFDETTYVNPFNEDKNIDTVYIITPYPTPGFDTTASVKRFIDLARQRGVGRFLLMGAAGVEKGAEFVPQGQIHAYLDAIGVDYAVLRPSRFFGNFLTVPSIKHDDELISATGKGRVGHVSEDDIADIAVDLLTASKLGGAEPIIVGPELLSYDDIAAQLSQVLGRKITHRNVSAEERKTAYIKQGLPEQLSARLTFSETNVIATGGDEKIYNGPGVVFGKTHFVEFVKANKAVWQK